MVRSAIRPFRDVPQVIEKSLSCVHMDQVDLEGISEGRDHGRGLTLPEQPIVHEQTRELVANGLVEQDGDSNNL